MSKMEIRMRRRWEGVRETLGEEIQEARVTSHRNDRERGAFLRVQKEWRVKGDLGRDKKREKHTYDPYPPPLCMSPMDIVSAALLIWRDERHKHEVVDQRGREGGLEGQTDSTEFTGEEQLTDEDLSFEDLSHREVEDLRRRAGSPSIPLGSQVVELRALVGEITENPMPRDGLSRDEWRKIGSVQLERAEGWLQEKKGATT
ncbi:hypothetical protein FB451DRAFT_1187567 [Mycena latifolia]|nr:hypothetical protein FB451DRAFT_1187567 [Mycena latifolia]